MSPPHSLKIQAWPRPLCSNSWNHQSFLTLIILSLDCLATHHSTSAKHYPGGKKVSKCWAQYFKANLMWAQICPEKQEQCGLWWLCVFPGALTPLLRLSQRHFQFCRAACCALCWNLCTGLVAFWQLLNHLFFLLHSCVQQTTFNPFSVGSECAAVSVAYWRMGIKGTVWHLLLVLCRSRQQKAGHRWRQRSHPANTTDCLQQGECAGLHKDKWGRETL